MILVSGGAGFIGSNLQAALVADGHATVVVDRLRDAGKWCNRARGEKRRPQRAHKADPYV